MVCVQKPQFTILLILKGFKVFPIPFSVFFFNSGLGQLLSHIHTWAWRLGSWTFRVKAGDAYNDKKYKHIAYYSCYHAA